MQDLTQGHLTKNILLFSLPFLLSYFLQTLYGMADLFIIGQYASSASISAVSIGSQFMHMLTVFMVGLASGAAILIGRYVGSHDTKSINKTIGQTIIIFVVLSLVMTIITSLLINPIINVMRTPTKAINETYNYLRICFLGIPFIISYNVISSILRGMGDSKTPMYIILVATIINIVLDFLFIGYFHMYSSGAALATVIAQAGSVVIGLIYIIKRKIIQLHKDDFIINKHIMGQIFKIGVPVSMQDTFIQISFLIITAIANSRGVEISAAVGIVEKIISFLFLVPSTMMNTVSTISSQAIGASRHDIALKVLKIALTICITFGVIVGIACQFISKEIVTLFTRDAKVIMYGAQYLRSYSIDTTMASIHFCFSGYFIAYGYSYISFIHNFLSIILLRVPGSYLASIYYPQNLFPMGLAAPAGSTLQVIICFIVFITLKKKHLLENPKVS